MLKNPYVSRAFGHFFDLVSFADALRISQDKMDEKNFYGRNPSFDKKAR